MHGLSFTHFLQFVIYEHLKKELKEMSGSKETSASHVVASASMAKLIACSVTYPHEVFLCFPERKKSFFCKIQFGWGMGRVLATIGNTFTISFKKKKISPFIRTNRCTNWMIISLPKKEATCDLVNNTSGDPHSAEGVAACRRNSILGTAFRTSQDLHRGVVSRRFFLALLK